MESSLLIILGLKSSFFIKLIVKAGLFCPYFCYRLRLLGGTPDDALSSLLLSLLSQSLGSLTCCRSFKVVVGASVVVQPDSFIFDVSMTLNDGLYDDFWTNIPYSHYIWIYRFI